MTPETKIKVKLKKLLKEADCFFSAISDRYHSGLPDFIAVKGGQVFFIEVKSQVGELTKLQAKTLNDAAAHGAHCIVYRGEPTIDWIYHV